MKKILLAFTCLYGVTIGSTCLAETGLMAHQPWVREAPPNMTMNAAYMELRNDSDNDLMIVGGQSKDFGKVEIHTTVLENDVAKMLPIPKLVIPAKKSVTLAPGGIHIMLLNRQHEVKTGDKIDITLQLKDGQTLPLSVEVKAAAPTAETDGMSEHHH
ncbi:hypothetical protein BegalDRAFT_0846 [Beggiatoa alba B18LD]|uniref:Copper chaperone PCu(A)C n=1 Tax=Beggiatoa alba B18LD TaxID=395493 RepID=I3CDR3_9GAMM|nr:copper chaperone PCu(A)C [Beggiatoa alba]EIJ41756.1 hypothetical protein BegalDRAFT_0846 [Beggiatoa alba B18LD]